MRTCIVGGGLAGALLAWRLAGEGSGGGVDVFLGGDRTADATEASGGIVRGYEPEPDRRALATDSLAELLDSPVLRHWSDYRRTGSVYVCPQTADLASVVSEIPGASLRSGRDLARSGWAGLPAGSVAVSEDEAGYFSPARLRQRILADLAPRVRLRSEAVTSVVPNAAGTVTCVAAGKFREYDVVVLAVGAWTAQLLRASELSAEGYRTRSIQYAVYKVGTWRPPVFVDEATGLYARPVGEDRLLLGLATDEWDVGPGRRPANPALHSEAVRLARSVFPQLRLGPALERVNATDCYTDPAILALRPVGDPGHRMFTFTGGSGGAAKTVLAASRRAARSLTDKTPLALREDHP